MLLPIQKLADLSNVRLQANDKIGIVDAMFQDELRRVLSDLYDRPTNETARKVVITMRCVPVTDDSGHLIEVKTDFEVKSALPGKRTREISMAAKGDEGLRFNDASPSDIHQTTLDQLPKPSAPQA